MITFACSGCGQKLRSQDKMAGRQTKCPRCGQLVPIPPATPSAAAVGEAETLPPGPAPAPDAAEEPVTMPPRGHSTGDMPREAATLPPAPAGAAAEVGQVPPPLAALTSSPAGSVLEAREDDLRVRSAVEHAFERGQIQELDLDSD